MWQYIRKYLPFAILAALFMIGQVMMDLIQPGLMDHGRIAAVGTHEELQENWEIYQDICRSQNG